MSLTDSALGRSKSGIRLSSRYDIARKILRSARLSNVNTYVKF